MNHKERYEKPELGVIELKAEEVLAVGCKNSPNTTNGTPPSCGLILIPCVVNGS